jgi:hypothetical protein
MVRYDEIWEGVAGSEPVPLFGFRHAVGLDPVPVREDRLAGIFRQGAEDLPPIWEEFLSTPSLAAIREAAAARPDVVLTDEAWTQILFEAAAGWRVRRLPPETLIKSLVPLYLGKVASFVAETREGTDDEAEARLDSLAAVFEERKDTLRQLWRAARR